MKSDNTSRIDYIVRPSGPLRGEIRVPGDKSISHRCVMLAAIADGDTRVTGLLEGEDVLATVEAFRAMGVRIEGPHGGEAWFGGVGRDGLRAPAADIDLGNSGTAMRLLAGLLSGQVFDCSLVGDDSLRRRPMRRITEPLSRMGARIETARGGTPPIRIRACDGLESIDYTVPVASAQVKSGILLAGLYANGRTCVTEPVPTRDHTERMLDAFGAAPVRDGRRTCIEGGVRLAATEIEVPGDISSAAFLLAAAAGRPGSDLLVRGVGVNPTRIGVLTILERMGADIEWSNRRNAGREPVADLRVRGAVLHGIDVDPALVPLAIDEFPAIFAAAAAARGVTRVTGAAELRVKESDRIAASAGALRALGVSVRVADDGMEVEGGAISGGEVDSEGDHRIAMAFASSAVTAPVRIRDCRNVATSFPGFETLAGSVGFDIEVVDAGG
ncbi:MAG: 3-phosphoshikimate 1-carboxyvinyltransferase [Chromatiales bacterium]|nr:3-phosphoshikimate 1-carboxyvinyltransferase [Chromatiales bacterium]